MIDIKGKKILLFAPSFFGYDIVIKEKLIAFGAIVDLYDERPSTNVFIKAIIRVYKKLLYVYIENYFRGIAKRNFQKDYDYVLVIKGEVFNTSIVENLRSYFPKARFILYLWDSIQNYKDIQQCLHLFDNSLTFDLEDSKSNPRLKFRPLFFMDEYIKCRNEENERIEYIYDLLFVGTVHSDRWLFLKSIKDQADKYNLNIYYYLYVQSPVVFLFRKLFDKRFWSIQLKDVKFRAIPKEEIVRLTSCSKAVIDIQHPNQTGLTMRTIEVFGAKRKLITTNSIIQEYDIFLPENIAVVDRLKPALSFSFITTELAKMPDELYYKYSLEGWLDSLFWQ